MRACMRACVSACEQSLWQSPVIRHFLASSSIRPDKPNLNQDLLNVINKKAVKNYNKQYFSIYLVLTISKIL